MTDPGRDAAKGFIAHVGRGILDIDADGLRYIAMQLDSKSEDLHELGRSTKECAEMAVQEAQAFITAAQPAPVYYALLDEFTTSTGHYRARIYEQAKGLQHDALALRWIADNYEEAQRVSVEVMNGVNVSLDVSRDHVMPAYRNPVHRDSNPRTPPIWDATPKWLGDGQ